MTLRDIKLSIKKYFDKITKKNYSIYYRDSAGNRILITDPPVSRSVYENQSIPLETMPDKSYEVRFEKMLPEDRIRALDVIVTNMINYPNEPDSNLEEGQASDIEVFTQKARSLANKAAFNQQKGASTETVAALFEKLFVYCLHCYESYRNEKRFNAQDIYNQMYKNNLNIDSER